jgi:hypothetical protein
MALPEDMNMCCHADILRDHFTIVFFFLKDITHNKQAWIIIHVLCRIGYIHIIFFCREIYVDNQTYYYNFYSIFLNQLCFEIVHRNKTSANSLMVVSN